VERGSDRAAGSCDARAAHLRASRGGLRCTARTAVCRARQAGGSGQAGASHPLPPGGQAGASERQTLTCGAGGGGGGTVARCQVVLPAWPAAAVAAAAGAAELASRRFGEALRLMRNMAALDGALPSAPLQQLALGRVLGDRVVPYLHSIPPLDALPKV
jgi:hypothetical protein